MGIYINVQQYGIACKHPVTFGPWTPLTEDLRAPTSPQVKAKGAFECTDEANEYLEDAVKRVEGEASKGRQRVLLVVLMVGVVQQPAQHSICFQSGCFRTHSEHMQYRLSGNHCH